MADQQTQEGGAVVGPEAEKALTAKQLLGHVGKDLVETLGPAELELLYSVTHNTLVQGGASIGTLAGQIHDLSRGISPTADQSAQNTAEASEDTAYKPHLEVSQFVSGLGGKLMAGLGRASDVAGDWVVDKLDKLNDPAMEAGDGQVLKPGKRADNASAIAALGTLTKMGTLAAPAALMRETPVSRAIKDRVTEPAKAALHQVYTAVQEKIHKGAYQASKDAQAMLTEQAGKEASLHIDVGQLYAGWKKQKVSAAESEHILNYMEDPESKAPLTDREQVLYQTYIKPYADALGWQPGHVHRIALEKPNPISAMMGGFKSPSITPRLSTQESAALGREMFKAVPETKDAPPLIVSIKPTPFKAGSHTATFFHAGDKVGMQEDLGLPEGKKSFKGETVTDAHGNKYRIEDASIKDIEAHTAVRYARNPVVMVGEAWREHHQAQYAKATLDKMKIAFGNQGLIASATDPRRPTSFVPLDNYHFHGYVAHPALARVINSMVGSGGAPRVLDAFNKAMLNASFVVPIWHQLNIAAFSISDEMARAAHPQVWRDLAGNVSKAYKEVSTFGPDYMELVNKGYPMMKARTLAAPTLKELTRQMLMETDSDRFKSMAGKLGVPAEVVRKGLHWFINNWEHGPVWTFNDAATMRAIYDRMSANPKLSLEAAADDTFKNFPTYEVPYSSSVLAGLQKSGLFWFLPYHLDRFRVLWNRAGGAALGDTQAGAQLAGTLLMQTVLFPELDKQLQEKSGNKKASVVRFGESELPDKFAKIANRDSSAWTAVGLLLTPTPPAQVLVSGAEYQATRKKHGKEPPLKEQAEAIGEDVAEKSIYPVYDLKQAGWDPSAGLLAQLGVKLPVSKGKKSSMPTGAPPLPKPP